MTDPDLYEKYLEYVEEFLETIYTNTSLIQEMESHAKEMEVEIKEDFWSLWGAFFDKELTMDAADWREEVPRFPLLPTMKARADDVRAQLKALKEGTMARAPHSDGTKNEPWETCADWRASSANTSMCEQGCQYVGCLMPEWTVPSFCDEATGVCYHGDYDENCRDVPDFDQYTGMVSDGKPTYCRHAAGIPVKTSECPAVGEARSGSQQANSGGDRTCTSSSSGWITFSGFLAATLWSIIPE